MCGIIACLKCGDTKNILLDGLKQLQNRGYDSCGISIIQENNFQIQKYASTNHKQSLEKLEEQYNLDTSHIGIAHTRWATHGGKTDINAHPHIDSKETVAIVHNGIITNYQNLKNKLLEEGFTFKGETDTEVISNLISSELQNNPTQPFQAISSAIKRMEGSWGLVIIVKEYPNSLFICKSGSPLLLGKTNEGIIVASELSAFCNRSFNVITLEDGEILEINLENDNINSNRENDNSLKSLFKNREKIPSNEIQIQKSPYPFSHWMIKEIMEQPMAILRTLNYGARILDNNIKLGGLNQEMDLIKDKTELVILGCGTSLNAGLWASHIFKKQRIFNSIKILDASEFEPYDISENDNTLVIVLSQSGETKDIHRCMVKIRELNIPIIGIVNSVGSLIARETDCGIYLNAGREVAVASTKSFTCQQIALTLVALWFLEKKSKWNVYSKDLLSELKFMSGTLETTLGNMEQLKPIAEFLSTKNSCFILGKNICEPIAREAALKLKEIGYIHAEAFPGGSLKHGPFSLIEIDTPVILLILEDSYKDFMISTLEEVKSRGAKTIIVTNVVLNCDKSLIDYQINIPKLKTLGSIPLIIPFQIIAYEMAIVKNHNPDYPRNLAKVVTVD
jgi:glutamine---fructose-6-phosphate transaminase (isomerizing)